MNTEQPTEKLEELGNSSRSTFENYWPFAFIFFLLVIVHLIKSFLCWIILYRRKKNEIESHSREIITRKNNIEEEKVGPADSIEQDENVGI